jgi:transposase
MTDLSEFLLRIKNLEAENAKLRQELADLQSKFNLLSRLLGLDSTTSSKPPSSDGLKKRTASLRIASGLPSGGQLGSKGTTLKRVETPDHTKEHRPAVCDACSAPITEETAAESIEIRQVFDIPPPKLEVTEHRVLKIRCACGHLNKGVFPENVRAPVQYGERVRAIASYLSVEQLLPEKRLCQTMKDVLNVPISAASIGNIVGKKAQEFAPQAKAIAVAILNAPLKHLDETGLRAKDKTRWLHVACDDWLTAYHLDEKRGAVPAITNGIVVHDHWKPYFKLEGVLHALCNAHHLREILALIKHEKEDWASKMQRFLYFSLKLVEMRKKNKQSSLSASQQKRLKMLYERIVEQGLEFHMRQMVIPPDLKRGTITAYFL